MTQRKFKAIIFDLDDTLFDTWGTCYPPATKEAAEAMVQEGLNCTVEQCVSERNNFFKTMPRRDVYQHLVKTFGTKPGSKSPEEIAITGKRTFHARQVEKDIKLFPQTKEVLATLKLNYMLFLVTSGYPQTQRQKVELLKVKQFFNHIYYVDVLTKQRKTAAFFEIIDHTSMPPEQILCVGDRRDREIAEGKRVGFSTCLLIRQHQMCIKAELPEEHADFEIERIGELLTQCKL